MVKIFQISFLQLQVCNRDITILLKWPSKNTFGLCLLMISWNCLSSIYPSIICTNYTELLRCTQRFVVSRSWGNGVTRCPVQNLKLYRHYEINADQMKSRRTKMQSRRTKMQSWRTKMQFRRTKIQSEQTKMQSERTKIKSERTKIKSDRTKMQPNTMSLKKKGRPLFCLRFTICKGTVFLVQG